jgi:hypothetical protein
MAKFLNTTGVSYHLEELMKSTTDRLILVSPYLQFSERVKEHLTNLNVQKKDIRIIYRENKLHTDENNWLESQIGIRTSICKTLHAKCYLNEKEAIITSMNLFAFSQINNNEMGIHITKAQDPELYNDTLQEALRLITISEEIRISIKKVSADAVKSDKKLQSASTAKLLNSGFCIRTGVQIPFDLKKPLSPEAFKSWSKYEDEEYEEKFCHFSGEASKGQTSYSKPILSKHWKKAKEVHGF